MNKIYTASYTLRAADFGLYSRLRPSSILDIFQDIAGRHAIELGCDGPTLLSRGLAWVIVKQRYRVLGEAKMYQTVTVSTWPLVPGRVGYQREYRIADETGAAIVEGSSEWVLMDVSNRRIASVGNIYPLADHCAEKVFPDGFPRLRNFEPRDEGFACLPPFSDFDLNGHVNNTKYANYVLDALSPAQEDVISSFQLDYHREVLPGTRLHILHRRDADTVLARGDNDSGEKMFSCRIEFQKQE